MNDLYNELTSSNTQYLENGEMRSNPPTSLQLRAARALKQLFEETQGLGRAYIQLQQEVAKLHEELELLKTISSNQFNELEKLKNDTNGTTVRDTSTNESVCDGEPKTSDVEG